MSHICAALTSPASTCPYNADSPGASAFARARVTASENSGCCSIHSHTVEMLVSSSAAICARVEPVGMVRSTAIAAALSPGYFVGLPPGMSLTSLSATLFGVEGGTSVDESKLCAKCGTRYLAEYDACPTCARRRGWVQSFIVALVILAVVGCCYLGTAPFV